MKFFLAHGLYGFKPPRHWQVYRIGVGWYCIEWASWSLEVETPNSWDPSICKMMGTPVPQEE